MSRVSRFTPHGLRCLRYHKAEMLRHGREIAIVVEQDVMVLDAERADDDVRRLADCNAQSP